MGKREIKRPKRLLAGFGKVGAPDNPGSVPKVAWYWRSQKTYKFPDLPDDIMSIFGYTHPTDWSVKCTADRVERLKALRDEGYEGVQAVIDALEQEGVIYVWREQRGGKWYAK